MHNYWVHTRVQSGTVIPTITHLTRVWVCCERECIHSYKVIIIHIPDYIICERKHGEQLPKTYRAPWKSIKSTVLALVIGFNPVQFNACGVHCLVQWVNNPDSRILLILVNNKQLIHYCISWLTVKDQIQIMHTYIYIYIKIIVHVSKGTMPW